MKFMEELEAFFETHGSRIWIVAYVLLLALLLYFGISAPTFLGPNNLEGK